MKTQHLTRTEFLNKIVDYKTNKEWKFLGSRPAIIDFYASWCGPCKTLSPILEELAQEYHDKIDIYKIDIEKEQELAGIFGVKSIPTLLFIPMNEKPQITQGAMGKGDLKKVIETFLLNPSCKAHK